MSRTSQKKIINALLEASHETTLEDFLTERRNQDISLERIARDLEDMTNGNVSVTGETIRRWINDLEAVA